MEYPFVEKLCVKSEKYHESTNYEIIGWGSPAEVALQIVQKGINKIIGNKMFCNDLIANNLKRIEFYERFVDISRGKLPPHKYIEVIFTIE